MPFQKLTNEELVVAAIRNARVRKTPRGQIYDGAKFSDSIERLNLWLKPEAIRNALDALLIKHIEIEVRWSLYKPSGTQPESKVCLLQALHPEIPVRSHQCHTSLHGTPRTRISTYAQLQKNETKYKPFVRFNFLKVFVIEDGIPDRLLKLQERKRVSIGQSFV